MSEVCSIGLDIAKNFFQAHGSDKFGNKIFNTKITRNKVLDFFANKPPCLVGIEACGGAHHRGVNKNFHVSQNEGTVIAEV